MRPRKTLSLSDLNSKVGFGPLPFNAAEKGCRAALDKRRGALRDAAFLQLILTCRLPCRRQYGFCTVWLAPSAKGKPAEAG